MFKSVKIKSIAMICNSCMNDQEKITWFDSGQQHFYDQAFYCKPCWRKYYLMQPTEKRKEWQL
jgi:hypothetical protein